MKKNLSGRSSPARNDRPARRGRVSSSAVLAPVPPVPAVPAGKWDWHYRTLIALREKLLRERAAKLHEAAEPIEPHGTHLADSATDEFDHDFAMTLLVREENALRDVQEAIYRILSGTYGLCELTKMPIPTRRLRALPWCRYTRAAELELERAGAVPAARVPPVVSLRGHRTNIPYGGEIPPEGMELEPKEHEEPKAGKATVEPARPDEESDD